MDNEIDNDEQEGEGEGEEEEEKGEEYTPPTTTTKALTMKILMFKGSSRSTACDAFGVLRCSDPYSCPRHFILPFIPYRHIFFTRRSYVSDVTILRTTCRLRHRTPKVLASYSLVQGSRRVKKICALYRKIFIIMFPEYVYVLRVYGYPSTTQTIQMHQGLPSAKSQDPPSVQTTTL
ncbi:hypothetical protein BU17DRAFT_63810 [Hysterangium stoloniferum]|nr:hypothetical protein BU17DRAFT_63810 [Hysterangium stoloniferum]